MPHSLAHVLVHLVFSTKDREPLIVAAMRPALHAYLSTVLQGIGCPSLRTGGAADHVHILLSLSRTQTIADVVEEAKIASSKWMKVHGVPHFWWQTGYAAFSVSPSEAAAVTRYIEQQDRHHEGVTYQDELRDLLRRHDLIVDERYLWD